MKDLFNKLKSKIDALTGSQEHILCLAKDAIAKVEGVYFREDNGVLIGKIDATDTFNRKVVRRLIPDKKSLTLEVVIDTIPDDDYAEMAARFDFGTPHLKGGVRNGQPCVTAVFEGASLKNPEVLADAIKSTLAAINATIDDFAAKLGLLLVSRTTAAVRAALKKRGDVDISNVVPLKQTAQATGVYATVKVNEFKYYKLRFACFEDDLHTTFYLTNINIDADKVIRIFSGNNLKALRLEDGSVKVYEIFYPDDFRTIKNVETRLTGFIDSLTKSLRQINEISPLGDAQLHSKVFDCWGIEEVFVERKDFKNYTHKGVITLKTPAGTGGFRFAINTTVAVLPEKVTVSCVVDASLKKDAAAEKIIADFNKKSADIQAEITSDGRLKVQGVELSSSYFDPPSAIQYGTKNVIELFNKVYDRWPNLLKSLGVEIRVFILDDVRQTLKNISGFNKIDDDGDIFFKFNVTEHFSHKCFVWVYIKPDRLEFDAGISNFKTDMPIEKGLEKVKATFKDSKDGISYRIHDDTTIRAKKSIYRKDFSDDNLSGQIKQAAERVIKELKARIEDVAEICGIPKFAVNKDTFKMACLKADLTEASVKHSEFEWDFGRISLCKDNRILVVIKRSTIGKTDDLIADIKKLDNRIDEISDVFNSVYVYFPEFNCNTFENLVSDLKDLRRFGNHVDDAIIEHNRRENENNDKKAEESRRRRLEAQEKAQLESAFNASYWMDINSDTEVRWIMKTFNEWFPYLRLGIYMVKTGQSADRNGDTISSYDLDTRMRQIRSFKGGGRITIYGRSTPADIENEFRSRLGLVVKVCYTDPDKKRYYISKDSSLYKKSIVEIERQFKKKGGYYYNDWY